MPEYICYCKKPRRRKTFFAEHAEAASEMASKAWDVPADKIMTGRNTLPNKEANDKIDTTDFQHIIDRMLDQHSKECD